MTLTNKIVIFSTLIYFILNVDCTNLIVFFLYVRSLYVQCCFEYSTCLLIITCTIYFQKQRVFYFVFSCAFLFYLYFEFLALPC